MTFLPAILLSGLFGGIRIGVLVAILCTLVAWVMFFPPYGTFILATPHVISVVIFVVTAALELYVIRSLNVAIDDLSEARERSNVLFRELQHRVANNLQLVAAVLMRRRVLLKSDPALRGSPGIRARPPRNHVPSPSPAARPEVARPALQTYLEALCGDLIKASDTPDIVLTVESPPLVLRLNALMSLSLIVAELVTNSLKHAFRDRSDGRIAIGITGRRGVYTLSVADDGPGLPADFGTARAAASARGYSTASPVNCTASWSLNWLPERWRSSSFIHSAFDAGGWWS